MRNEEKQESTDSSGVFDDQRPPRAHLDLVSALFPGAEEELDVCAGSSAA